MPVDTGGARGGAVGVSSGGGGGGDDDDRSSCGSGGLVEHGRVSDSTPVSVLTYLYAFNSLPK